MLPTLPPSPATHNKRFSGFPLTLGSSLTSSLVARTRVSIIRPQSDPPSRPSLALDPSFLASTFLPSHPFGWLCVCRSPAWDKLPAHLRPPLSAADSLLTAPSLLRGHFHTPNKVTHPQTFLYFRSHSSLLIFIICICFSVCFPARWQILGSQGPPHPALYLQGLGHKASMYGSTI